MVKVDTKHERFKWVFFYFATLLVNLKQGYRPLSFINGMYLLG